MRVTGGRTAGLLGASTLLLAACASVSPPPLRPGFAPTPQKTAAAPADPRHRQYFDQRRRRYYYFDPAQKRYFWENGQPKT